MVDDAQVKRLRRIICAGAARSRLISLLEQAAIANSVGAKEAAKAWSEIAEAVKRLFAIKGSRLGSMMR